MPIPDFESMMLPILKIVENREEWSMGDVEEKLTKHFNLNEEEKNQLKPSSTTETIFQNRMRWARFYLKKAGLLEDPRRSFTKITQQGINVLQENLNEITIDYLKRFPTFLEFFNKKRSGDAITVIETGTATPSKSPEDMIISGYTEIRNNLENEILERIKSIHPQEFEQLVLHLLEKMGYGDGTVTGKSGDGGIDGMIKEDRLGLSEIYVQAKKWANPVPVKEIRDFAGSLSGTKSKKGIFITTSSFSKDTLEFVKNVDSKIILIDGEKLASLMFDYNIGFQPGETYQLKKIDEDYFL